MHFNFKKSDLLLIVFSMLFASVPEMATAQVQMKGNILLSTPSYDYSPSYMIDQWDNNKHKIWWCGIGADGSDVVLYSERPDYAHGWSQPQAVLKHSSSRADIDRFGTNPSYEGLHLCDPSVVRGSFPVSGIVYTYALYYSTDSPVRVVNDSKVGVAFSNDGRHWTRFPLPVVQSVTPNNTAYGSGQQVVFSADGGSAIHMIHTEVSPSGAIRYFYRFAKDGIHFGGPTALSTNGFGFISFMNPAIAAASGGNYLYISKVETTYSDAVARSIAVYRIPFNQLASGKWQKVVSSSGVKAVEVEPGFITDAYGSLNATLPNISTIFACSGTGSPYTWDLCYGNARL